MMKKIILAIVLSCFLYGCKTVPMVGRRQLTLVPAFYLEMLSASSFQEVISQSKISTNVQQSEMLDRVGNRIRLAVEAYFAEHNMSSHLKGFSWEFVLIDDPSINAWVMPGGRIAFYTGILPVCANEDGVAVVMGHEIAHAVLRHGNERMSQALVQQFGSIALSVALSEQPEMTQALFLQAFGIGTTVFGILPYNRKREYEADRIGLKFMAMAGYDPREGPKFWQRMMALSKNPSASDFLSTHPSNAKRIAELEKLVPEAMKYFRPHPDSNPELLALTGNRRRGRADANAGQTTRRDTSQDNAIFNNSNTNSNDQNAGTGRRNDPVIENNQDNRRRTQ